MTENINLSESGSGSKLRSIRFSCFHHLCKVCANDVVEFVEISSKFNGSVVILEIYLMYPASSSVSVLANYFNLLSCCTSQLLILESSSSYFC